MAGGHEPNLKPVRNIASTQILVVSLDLSGRCRLTEFAFLTLLEPHNLFVDNPPAEQRRSPPPLTVIKFENRSQL